MSNLKNVTYCGLHCKLCSTKSRVPRQASALRETLAKDGWESYGEHLIAGFDGFWRILDKFSEFDTTCPDCREGCGDPGCKIRICAKEKGVDLCSSCGDYPCEHVHELAKRYPNVIADGMRQKEVGLEQWIVEQEARGKTGYCYCDTRFP